MYEVYFQAESSKLNADSLYVISGYNKKKIKTLIPLWNCLFFYLLYLAIKYGLLKKITFFHAWVMLFDK